MNTYNLLKEMITTVARTLGEEMLDEVAFVGGCTTGLLLTDEFSREAVRYTDEVSQFPGTVEAQRIQGIR